MILFPRIRPIIGLTVFLSILISLSYFGGTPHITENWPTSPIEYPARRLDELPVPESVVVLILQPTVSSPTISSHSSQEIESLAALCVVEAMNMEEARLSACASILSTVFLRTAREILSDGTILGTLRWNCGVGDVWCQFPAYVTYNCEGILPSRCPWNYPDQMEYFRVVVQNILAGLLYPEGCYDYLFYDSLPGDDRACVIQSQRGVWIEFSN